MRQERLGGWGRQAKMGEETAAEGGEHTKIDRDTHTGSVYRKKQTSAFGRKW